MQRKSISFIFIILLFISYTYPQENIESLKQQYPDILYIYDVGTAMSTGNKTEDRNNADDNARAEIGKQIRVNIKEEIFISVFEKSFGNIRDKDWGQKVKKIINSSVNIVLNGCKIVKRWKDDDMYYSFAVLDREIASNVLRSEINNSIDNLKNYIDSAEENFKNGNCYDCILNYLDGIDKIIEINEKKLILEVIKTEEFKIDLNKNKYSISNIKNKLQAILSNITIEKINTGTIDAFFNKPLQENLKVKVKFYNNEGIFPCSNFKINYDFILGKGELDISSLTNLSGVSECRVSKVFPSSSRDYKIEAKIDFSAFLDKSKLSYSLWKNIYENYKKGTIFYLERKSVSLNDLIQELVLKLNRNLNIKYNKMKVLVSSFTFQDAEVTSQFVKYLIDQIEYEISNNTDLKLIKSGVTNQILKTKSMKYKGVESAHSVKGISNFINADGIISGNYWLIQNNIKVIANLTHSRTEEILSSASINIPKNMIPNEISIRPTNFDEVEDIIQEDIITPKVTHIPLDIWVDKLSRTYEDGDTIRVFFKSGLDCYIRLFYFDATGNIWEIFPNSDNINNKIIGNKTYEYEYLITSPYGSEVIKAIASNEQVPELDGEYIKEYGLKKIYKSNGNIMKKIKDISSKNNKIFGEDRCVVTTIPKK